MSECEKNGSYKWPELVCPELSRTFIMTVYAKATQRFIFIVTYNKPVLYMLYGPSFAKKKKT